MHLPTIPGLFGSQHPSCVSAVPGTWGEVVAALHDLAGLRVASPTGCCAVAWVTLLVPILAQMGCSGEDSKHLTPLLVITSSSRPSSLMFVSCFSFFLSFFFLSYVSWGDFLHLSPCFLLQKLQLHPASHPASFAKGLPCLWWHTPVWEVPFILSALFSKAILAAIICPHMTSPINFNGLPNQVLTSFHSSLHFTFLLILIQAPGERHTMLCLGTSSCWLMLRTVLHLSRFILL